MGTGCELSSKCQIFATSKAWGSDGSDMVLATTLKKQLYRRWFTFSAFFAVATIAREAV